ncbi:MAG: hypothetical protein ACTHL7_10245, partial [Steroidobacteraceae bacterium]
MPGTAECERTALRVSIFATAGACNEAAGSRPRLPTGGTGTAPDVSALEFACAALFDAGSSTSLPSPWIPNSFSIFRSA